MGFLSISVHLYLYLYDSYHLHWVCEDHSIEPYKVLVVQRVHGVHFLYEVIQTLCLVQQICLQALHCNIKL